MAGVERPLRRVAADDPAQEPRGRIGHAAGRLRPPRGDSSRETEARGPDRRPRRGGRRRITTTGNLTGFDDGAELRRLRLVAGGDYLILVPFSYKIESATSRISSTSSSRICCSGTSAMSARFKWASSSPRWASRLLPAAGISLSWNRRPLSRPSRPASAPASRPASPSTARGRPISSVSSARAPVPAIRHASRRYGVAMGRIRACPSTVRGGESLLDPTAPSGTEHQRTVFGLEQRALPVPPGKLHRSLRDRHGRHRRERVGDARRRVLVGERAGQPSGGIPSFLGRGIRRRPVELRRLLRFRELVSDRAKPAPTTGRAAPFRASFRGRTSSSPTRDGARSRSPSVTRTRISRMETSRAGASECS